MRILALGSVFVLLMSASGCKGPEYPTCKNDSQCKADAMGNPVNGVCVFGRCQECVSDADRKNGGRCHEYQCMANDPNASPCVSSADCSTGYMCSDGLCSKSMGKSDGTCDMTGTVYFDFNRDDLKADATNWLESFGQCLRDNPDWKVTVSGHTDERGSTEYNLLLGERRAKAVAKQLTRMGISSKRMQTTSYGQEKPADPSSNEEAWAKNRRSEIMAN